MPEPRASAHLAIGEYSFGRHTRAMANQGFAVELEREEDGRWIAEVPSLPGVMVYAETHGKALARVEALALRVLADRLEHGEAVPEVTRLRVRLPRPSRKSDRAHTRRS